MKTTMKTKRMVSAAFAAAFAALACGAYEGPTFTVKAWKGEKTYAKIPGRFAGELAPFDGASSDGVAVRLGAFAPVVYDSAPGAPFLKARRDRFTPFADGFAAAPDSCVVEVAPDAAPGVRSFGPLEVSVVDRVLPPPAEWKYFLDLWQHPWAVARYADVEPFSPEHYAAMEPVWRTLADSGVKALTVTLLDLPWNHQCYDAYHSMIGRVKKGDGTWEFDYAVFDEYVEFGRGCGIGPDIACYTLCPWGYVVRWRNEAGGIERAVAKPGTAAFEDYWGAFLVSFAAHLREKGWFEDAYIAMDERSPEDVMEIARFVQEKVPGMKIAMAGNRKPSDFKGIVIDNYSQAVALMEPGFLEELDGRRAAGYKTTIYVCCGPLRPNTFMESPDDEAFWLGVYPAMAGFDGFLRWAANSWPADPYTDATFGTWRAGDTFLVYPGGEISLRLANLRAGVVAAEKLRILSEDAAFKEGLKPLAAKFEANAAVDGKADFRALREEVETLVNR